MRRDAQAVPGLGQGRRQPGRPVSNSPDGEGKARGQACGTRGEPQQWSATPIRALLHWSAGPFLTWYALRASGPAPSRYLLNSKKLAVN
jgi:hypothetical protein